MERFFTWLGTAVSGFRRVLVRQGRRVENFLRLRSSSLPPPYRFANFRYLAIFRMRSSLPMRDIVYHLVFDGLSDWETALALAEINKNHRYTVRSVGLTPEAVVTAAGLRLLPDLVLADLDGGRAAAMVIPGGSLWEHGGGEAVDGVVERLVSDGVPVATICGGTLVAARTGLLSERRFTSNMPGYIERFVEDFEAGERYVNGALAVTDRGVVTASAVGSVEFARELLRELGVYDEAGLSEWFALFKHGEVPSRYQ